jgi:hypothetical protein
MIKVVRKEINKMLPICSEVEVYRAIRGRDHASHLRPAIATRPRNTIFPSAYHCLEQHQKQRSKHLLYYILISAAVNIIKQSKGSASSPP